MSPVPPAADPPSRGFLRSIAGRLLAWFLALALVPLAVLGVVTTRVEPEASPGTGTFVEWEGKLLLGCSDCALELIRVKPEGRSDMDAAAYLRGYGLPGA